MPCRVVFERPLGHRADQDFQQLGIDGAFRTFGQGVHAVVSNGNRIIRDLATPVPYSAERCRPGKESSKRTDQLPPELIGEFQYFLSKTAGEPVVCNSGG